MTDKGEVERGLFLTLDGIDGVGKSTQIQRLSDYLTARGHKVLAVRDPGSTEIGMKLRELLLDSQLEIHRRTEAMLFMASRCEMIEKTIRPALDEGTCVISDRFLLANVVYQSVGGEVPAEKLWQMGHLANDGLMPDITVLLDMPAEAALGRIARPADRMEQRGVEYMEAVRQAFLAQLEQSSPATAVVRADRPAADVGQDVIDAVQHWMDR